MVRYKLLGRKNLIISAMYRFKIKVKYNFKDLPKNGLVWLIKMVNIVVVL